MLRHIRTVRVSELTKSRSTACRSRQSVKSAYHSSHTIRLVRRRDCFTGGGGTIHGGMIAKGEGNIRQSSLPGLISDGDRMHNDLLTSRNGHNHNFVFRRRRCWESVFWATTFCRAVLCVSAACRSAVSVRLSGVCHVRVLCRNDVGDVF